MRHIVQPVGDERALQRFGELIFALQALLQVLAEVSHPAGHVDKRQYFLLQILIAVQPVQ